MPEPPNRGGAWTAQGRKRNERRSIRVQDRIRLIQLSGGSLEVAHHLRHCRIRPDTVYRTWDVCLCARTTIVPVPTLYEMWPDLGFSVVDGCTQVAFRKGVLRRAPDYGEGDLRLLTPMSPAWKICGRGTCLRRCRGTTTRENHARSFRSESEALGRSDDIWAGCKHLISQASPAV